jgi:cell division protein FtsL
MTAPTVVDTMTAPTVVDSRRAHPAARPVPVKAPSKAPLKVVPDGYRPPRHRRRRARLLTATCVVLACGLLFALVGIHVLLTQGQFRLGRLQTQADDAQAQYVRLRLQVAELESPQRIVADAQERLGMISPSALTYLTPTNPTTPTTAKHTTSTVPRTTHKASDATQGWAAAKPALASHP